MNNMKNKPCKTDYFNLDGTKFNDAVDYLPNNYAKKVIQQIRDIECFKFTDRPLWYNRLSDIEKKQVDNWYEEWLNATITFVQPIKPYFIK